VCKAAVKGLLATDTDKRSAVAALIAHQEQKMQYVLLLLEVCPTTTLGLIADRVQVKSVDQTPLVAAMLPVLHNLLIRPSCLSLI
jgi:hypothetical protein